MVIATKLRTTIVTFPKTGSTTDAALTVFRDDDVSSLDELTHVGHYIESRLLVELVGRFWEG